MRVKYVVIYHNTSTSDRGLDLEFTARCAKAGGPTDKTICTDVTVESGEVEPSSLGAALLTPLPFWALSLAWIALGIWFL